MRNFLENALKSSLHPLLFTPKVLLAEAQPFVSCFNRTMLHMLQLDMFLIAACCFLTELQRH